MADGQTLGERFCRRLIDSIPDARSRAILIMELAKWGGKTLYLPAGPKRSARRVSAARNMLNNGMSVAESALAIHERFGISLRQAQRDVESARQVSREDVAS
jgi:Mor family transcriptional regulator